MNAMRPTGATPRGTVKYVVYDEKYPQTNKEILFEQNTNNKELA